MSAAELYSSIAGAFAVVAAVSFLFGFLCSREIQRSREAREKQRLGNRLLRH